MRAHKIKTVVPTDHQLSVTLPEDFPAGPAEVIVLTDVPLGPRVVSLAGLLAPEVPLADKEDPIAEALQELRRERQKRFATGGASERDS